MFAGRFAYAIRRRSDLGATGSDGQCRRKCTPTEMGPPEIGRTDRRPCEMSAESTSPSLRPAVESVGWSGRGCRGAALERTVVAGEM